MTDQPPIGADAERARAEVWPAMNAGYDAVVRANPRLMDILGNDELREAIMVVLIAARPFLATPSSPAIPVEGECLAAWRDVHGADSKTDRAFRAGFLAATPLPVPDDGMAKLVEALREARGICQSVREDGRHSALESDDYRRGFNAGASGCEALILQAINVRTALASIKASEPEQPRDASGEAGNG